MQGTQVRSLVGELRSCMLCLAKKKKKTKTAYVGGVPGDLFIKF